MMASLFWIGAWWREQWCSNVPIGRVLAANPNRASRQTAFRAFQITTKRLKATCRRR
jgi:hypothetical protein